MSLKEIYVSHILNFQHNNSMKTGDMDEVDKLSAFVASLHCNIGRYVAVIDQVFLPTIKQQNVVRS